jgi:hypothetical protein
MKMKNRIFVLGALVVMALMLVPLVVDQSQAQVVVVEKVCNRLSPTGHYHNDAGDSLALTGLIPLQYNGIDVRLTGLIPDSIHVAAVTELHDTCDGYLVFKAYWRRIQVSSDSLFDVTAVGSAITWTDYLVPASDYAGATEFNVVYRAAAAGNGTAAVNAVIYKYTAYYHLRQ